MIINRVINFLRMPRAFSTTADMQPMFLRNYQGAIEALNNLQSNAAYLKRAAEQQAPSLKIPEVVKYLERSDVTLEELDTLSVIHVTGTNGKGTTCAYSENILRHHGYKTGFFSSPHLLDVRERIRINGKPLSKQEFSEHFWKIYDLLDSQKESHSDMPLYFRYMTLMAIHVFLAQKVDVAIFEVGIGGEHDCTNVVRKTLVAGITPLDLDHTSLLGNTLESIAWNKSGIMKEGCITFTVNQPENVLKVFRDRSKEKNCTLKIVDKNYYEPGNSSRIPLHIQETNASLAIAITEAFIQRDINNNVKFSLDVAKKCIAETYWPGRYEIKPYGNITFFIDGAHTLESIGVCRNWFTEKTSTSTKAKVLIFNLTGKRNAPVFFDELAKCDSDVVIFTPNVGSENDRADTNDLKFTKDQQLACCEDYRDLWLEQQKMNSHRKQAEVIVRPSFSKALKYLEDGKEYNALVTGSIHLVGAAMSIIDPTLGGTLDE